MSYLINIIGIILVITGIFDSIKYKWSSDKIKQAGTARGQSRKFINCAILNDTIRIVYAILIKDMYILLTSLLALYFMIVNFYYIYKYYPYRCRGLMNFKKPNIFLYILNSILPNQIRKKL